MLRITPNVDAGRARSYYSTADYYSEGQELEGHWRGEGAARLGLSGTVQQAEWDALCDNRNPETGARLTLRQKTVRRVGYDFNWHAPKSVSLLYNLTGDDRLLAAFRESVDETMRDMEAEMQTRIRKAGHSEDRVTGNMAWGEFVHLTARPVDGLPDPHLHAHCFVFNSTWDEQEQAWKAGQFGDLKRDAPYFEAKFHARLAHRLGQLGLPVERTATGWEIAGLEPNTLEKFSRRTAEIEAEAQKRGIVDPAEKAELGAKTRQRKQKELTLPELRREWTARMSVSEQVAIGELADRIGGAPVAEDSTAARDAIRLAADHVFERKSVVPERTLLAESLKRATGRCSAESVEYQFPREGFLIGQRNGRRMATTRGVLSEEHRMIEFARSGRGTGKRLGAPRYVVGQRPRFDAHGKRITLTADQRTAAEHVLRSSDRVILIRGAAGVGKTTMMREAVDGIEAGGRKVFTFAPSAGAKSVLQEDGFHNAETVARLLVDPKLQAELKGQVLWVDEAGLLGSRSMGQVFELARQQDCRVVLSGDRRQHGAVERGAVLSLLEREAGIVPAEISEIQRQQGDYKQAVQALSVGLIADGFDQLDRLGWIHEAEEGERYRAIAKDYTDSTAKGVSTQIVSPTHLEGERITAAIREELRRAGRLGTEEQAVMQLTSTNLTEAERTDPANYRPGDVLVYHQHAKGVVKGTRRTVGIDPVPVADAKKFQVFRQDEIRLSVGDPVRITRNGQTRDGKHRLINGAVYRLQSFDQDGNLVLNNGWTVAKDYGHLAPGYVVTSHASQGKTVDRVIIGQSAESFPASSREQFYVSCSRGRKSVAIYTDDKESLLAAVSQSDDRMTATELVTGKDWRDPREIVQRQRRQEREIVTPTRERELTYGR